MTGIRRYEPLRLKHGFRHRAAQVRVADVRIVASASTPLAVEADASAETTLLVPFRGWGTSLVDGREHRWQAGNSAMFLPGSARTGESGVRSVVAITLDPRRLLLARERLLSGANVTTVAAVAESCGFTRLGAFAAAYARRFGESPSETLRRRRRDS